MTRYLLGAALVSGIVAAAVFGTVERGAQLMASAEQAGDAEFKTTTSAATPPAATVPAARRRARGDSMLIEIPEGTRAVAVRVRIEPGATEFILPGSRVDILATYGEGDEKMWGVILSNVLLLVVDSIPTREGVNNKEFVPETIPMVFALRPEDAQTLARAAERSEIRVILRAPDDEKQR